MYHPFWVSNCQMWFQDNYMAPLNNANLLNEFHDLLNEFHDPNIRGLDDQLIMKKKKVPRIFPCGEGTPPR